MNARLIEALKEISNAVNNMVEILSEETEVVNKKPVKNDTKEVEVETEAENCSEETTDELDNMSYSSLKALAKQRGVSAVGTKDVLLDRLRSCEPTETEEEVEVEETTKKPANKKGAKNLKKEPVVEEEDEDEEEEVDPIYQQVLEAVEDMDNEEIADLLTDIGYKPKGKREALIALVVKAVNEGLIDLDGDGEESEDEADDNTEYGVNDIENPNMTEERKAAIEAFIEETKDMIKEGELDRKTIVEWLQDFTGTKDKMTKVSMDSLVESYIEYSCLFIDDEGNMPEEESTPYTVNGEYYCCGTLLEEDEDGNLHCESCDETYESE